MITVGLVGGAGYTGGELIRLLLRHPETELRWVHSQSQAGKALVQVHRDLLGECDHVFVDQVDEEVDVIFFCAGHGKTGPFLAEHPISSHTCMIDLSSDFRIKGDHNFVYGLPELNKGQIQKAIRIANPGCFATAIQVGLLPLAAAGLLRVPVHSTAITGSTGAGQQPTETTHFSWRNNNVSVYKAFTHQHLGEISQSLQQLDKAWSQELFFVPLRGGFARGILASSHLTCPLSLEEAQGLYEEYYADHPFVLPSLLNPDLKQVVNTNKAVVYLEKHGDQLLIISAIDNLLKGASGQALQNMNLALGLPETLGLQLKASAF